MNKHLSWLAFLLFNCASPAFLVVTIDSPPQTTPPQFDTLSVTITADIDGESVSKLVTFSQGTQTLSTSFFLEFSPERLGTPVDVEITATNSDIFSFHASGASNIGEEVSLLAEFCGDSTTQEALGETCDDGNLIDNDGCTTQCKLATCGDGFLSAQEQCDDGNLIDNDGCDSTCTFPDTIQLSSGFVHTCALLDTKKIRCWGSSILGQLGYAPLINVLQPKDAGDVPIPEPIKQVAAGDTHTCVLLVNGAVKCWGSGLKGQLGYGNTNIIRDASTAPSIELGGTAIQIAAGGNHTCALLDIGRVKCWGDGSKGQLGYGNTISIGDNETPASAGLLSIGGNVAQIVAGSNHTCALLINGTVKCWGDGENGQLGYGNTFEVSLPANAPFVNVGGTVTQLSASGNTTCARLGSIVRCWGSGLDPISDPLSSTQSGILGYNEINIIGDNEVPASKPPIQIGGSVSEISTGGTLMCARLSTNSARCWGFGKVLGYGEEESIGDDETPEDKGDINLGAPIKQISAGRTFACAITNIGNVRCWGFNNQGLGYGSTDSVGDDEQPAELGDIAMF